MEYCDRVLPGDTLRGATRHHSRCGRGLLPGPYNDDGKKVCGCISHARMRTRDFDPAYDGSCRALIDVILIMNGIHFAIISGASVVVFASIARLHARVYTECSGRSIRRPPHIRNMVAQHVPRHFLVPARALESLCPYAGMVFRNCG